MTPRQFSDELLKQSDAELLGWWDAQYESARSLRGWYWNLYGEVLRGKRVLEIGSGFGFDAIHFASLQASVTCCDIAPSNLEVIRRVAGHRGLAIETQHLGGLQALKNLARDFDAVWAIGSIHHIPFDEAREESLAIIEHLKAGGRWIELSYPRERWVREGSLPFNEWGRRTDGERTPWVEWYDAEKLKVRLHPWRLRTIHECRYESDSFIWIDCEVLGREAETPIARRSVAAPSGTLVTPGPIWSHARSVALGPSPAGRAVTVEIECHVDSGSVGFALWLEYDNRFVSREVIMESRTGQQRLYLTADTYSPDVQLLTRNATALGASKYRIASISVRQAL
jgi:SAM-dependent methyltransferase